MGLLLFALAFAWVALSAGGAAQANIDRDGRRLALVVGNSDYQSIYSLKNAAHDAQMIAETLERLGFEVTALENASREEFHAAVERISRDAEGAEATLFYFAGHGFQLGGANYLVPSDAALQSREAIPEETLRLDWVISRLQARNRQTLIFLDACRNNPLPASTRGEANLDGLAQIETGSGTFVAFATQPGNVTFDGEGDNGYFASALLEHIEEPGISISDMMIRVRNTVEETTLHRQTPWDQSSLRSQFYFSPQGEGGSALTDEDRELLLSLDPELRKKFEVRFGLRIESVDEPGAPAAPQVPVIQAVSIESVPAPETQPREEDQQVALAEPERRPAEERPVIGALTILPADGDIPASDTPAVVALPTPRPEGPARQAAEALPSGEPAEDEIVIARLDPNQGAQTPSVVDPVRLPSAASPRAPQAVQGRDAPVPSERLALNTPPPGPLVRGLSNSDAVSLTPSIADSARAARGNDVPAAVATNAPSSAPTLLDDAVALAPVSGSQVRIQGRPVSDASEEVEVAALQPEVPVQPEPAPLPLPSSVPGAPTLVPAPQAVPAPPAAEPEVQLAAIDPKEISPDLIQRAPVAEEERQAEIPEDLPRALQAELARLGCYRSTVDGIWGSQSARALLRYYATKKESPDELEPNAALYARLTAEETVVCARTESARPAETERPRATTPRNERPATTRGNNRPQQSAPTAQNTRPQPPANRATTRQGGGEEGKRTLRGGLSSRGVFR